MRRRRVAGILTAIRGCAAAIAAAKAENMPNDNIKRAIQRGTGELEGASYEEITFEGYGPGGVAVIIEVTTDNRNRAVSEIRHCFLKERRQSRRVELGSLHVFEEGHHRDFEDVANEEQLMNIVLETGGDDLNDEGDTWEIITEPAAFEAVARSREGCGDSDADVGGHDDRLDVYQARGRCRRRR